MNDKGLSVRSCLQASQRKGMLNPNAVRGLLATALALGCFVLGQPLLAQDAGAPSRPAQGVIYRCVSPGGSVRYTTSPKVGCVVLFTYTAKPKQQRAPDNSSTQLIERGSYLNTGGTVVHSPAHTISGAVPPGASAQCRDGSYSFSLHHRGTCSHHGGVARWL
jgi:hypothetical protein